MSHKLRDNQIDPIGDALLDRRTVAAALGITVNAVSTMLCRGNFPIAPIYWGNRPRWRASAVRRFISEAEGDVLTGATGAAGQ
jgi:hypothetical protein